MDEQDNIPGPSDTHRFFAVATDEIYEGVRAYLDELWDHPRNGTVTALWPTSQTRHDAQGRPLVAVRNEEAAWPDVADQIADLITIGYVTEITRSEWDQAATPTDED
jgi:hypothetical protein